MAQIHKIGHLFIYSSISPDGTCVASGGEDRTVRIWNAGTGEELVCCQGHEDITVKMMSITEGGHIFSEGLEGTTFTHQVEGYVNTVDFSPDGRFLVSGSDDETVRVWDVTTGNELSRFSSMKSVERMMGESSRIWFVKFHSNECIAAMVSNGLYFCWNWKTGKHLHERGHCREIYLQVAGCSLRIEYHSPLLIPACYIYI